MNRGPFISSHRSKVDSSRIALRCGICLDDIHHLAVTKCGHLFCYECIKRVTDGAKSRCFCPSCKKRLGPGDADIQRAYVTA